MTEADLTASFEGHTVLDPDGATVGKVAKVIYDSDDDLPSWMIVDRGLLRPANYVPATGAYATPDDCIVVPFDKQRIKTAPRADRTGLTEPIRSELHLHYELDQTGS